MTADSPPETSPQEPSSPPAGLPELFIEEIVTQYLREMARYEKAAQTVAERLRRELRAEARFRHLISFRAKHPDDVREKLGRTREDRQHYTEEALRKNLNDVMTDLAGCRVVVYASEDEALVLSLIDRTFVSPNRGDTKTQFRKPTGYKASHRLVLADREDEPEDLVLVGAICEIQVTTMAAHLFNELEHDITYKDRGQPPSEEEKSFLNDLRRVTDLADRQVAHLINARRTAAKDNHAIESSQALRFALESKYDRALSGDFHRLFEMLRGAFAGPPLSIAVIRRLVPFDAVMVHGKELASTLKLGDDDIDDVVLFVLGLEEQHQEFLKRARSWRGPRTPLKRALDALSAHRQSNVDNETDPSQSEGDASNG